MIDEQISKIDPLTVVTVTHQLNGFEEKEICMVIVKSTTKEHLLVNLEDGQIFDAYMYASPSTKDTVTVTPMANTLQEDFNITLKELKSSQGDIWDFFDECCNTKTIGGMELEVLERDTDGSDYWSTIMDYCGSPHYSVYANYTKGYSYFSLDDPERQTSDPTNEDLTVGNIKLKDLEEFTVEGRTFSFKTKDQRGYISFN